MMRATKALALLVAGVVFAQASAALAAGKFVYVVGDVTVREAGGAQRPAKTGEQVKEKDSVQIGDGSAHIRFNDGGWIALRQRTVLEVSEFSERDAGNTVLSLLKGAARAVTGKLATRNPASYKLVTPTATIGIRGTSFQVTYCLQSCDLPDGLYVTGGDGTIFVKNAVGELDLSKGKTAYVANAQTPPRESDVKPVVGIDEPMNAQQTAATGSSTSAELRPGNFIYFEGTSGYQGPFEFRTVTSMGLAAAASGTFTGNASGILKGIFESASGTATGSDSGAGAGTVSTGDTVTFVLDALQRPISVTAIGANGDRISATSLTAPQLSSGDGTLFWGRWTDARFQFDIQSARHGGTNVTGSANVPAGSYMHYMFGTPATSVPLTGSATYTFIGGTGSTSQLGVVGAGVTAGSLTANFGGQTVSANLSISHNGTYTATGNSSILGSGRARFESFTGSATGPGGTSPFKFNGFFAGTPAPTAPPRAGIGWTIDKAGDPFSGTAGFRCSTGC